MMDFLTLQVDPVTLLALLLVYMRLDRRLILVENGVKSVPKRKTDKMEDCD